MFSDVPMSIVGESCLFFVYIILEMSVDERQIFLHENLASVLIVDSFRVFYQEFFVCIGICTHWIKPAFVENLIKHWK